MAKSPENFKDRVDWVADLFMVILSSVILLIALLAICCRYMFNHSLFWSDEVIRYIFVWFVFFGTVLALRDREHIRVEYFVELLPSPTRRLIELAMLFGILLFYLAMLVLGLMWVWETRGTSTSALRWPLNWFFYAALPVSAIPGVWYCLRRIGSGQYTELDSTSKESDEPMGGPG